MDEFGGEDTIAIAIALLMIYLWYKTGEEL